MPTREASVAADDRLRPKSSHVDPRGKMDPVGAEHTRSRLGQALLAHAARIHPEDPFGG
jgi:hypothetical protein